ncbi:hypothetical protein OEZ85_000206 [Tetradesmus obliquus]|uniref:Thioredoxin domain-containing protein n=1 Tax=Tetradesmus obliquus TaxID=3088 RepID=A0ABY8UPV8_TETOB|nr:hypothetical protein OEZ85_000206 [Tetradesmus obliquus]
MLTRPTSALQLFTTSNKKHNVFSSRGPAPITVPKRLTGLPPARSQLGTVAAPLSDIERHNAERRRAYEEKLAQQRAEEEQLNTGAAWWEVECPPNMINVASLDQLKTTVEGECAAGKLVVVNFFAPECYACKSMQPKLRQIARDNPDAVFLKVNGLVGDLMQYVEAMQITRIPYFHFYKNNKRVAEFSANMRPDKLALLRAEIAAHKEQPVAATDTSSYQALEA